MSAMGEDMKDTKVGLPVVIKLDEIIPVLKEGTYWFVAYPSKALNWVEGGRLACEVREIEPVDYNATKAYELTCKNYADARDTIHYIISQLGIPELKGQLIVEFKIRAPGLPANDAEYLRYLVHGDEEA